HCIHRGNSHGSKLKSHPRHSPSFPTRRSSDLPAPHRRQLEPRPERRRRSGEEQRAHGRLSRRRGAGGDGDERRAGDRPPEHLDQDRKSTRLNSSHVATSYAVFCFKKKLITEL